MVHQPRNPLCVPSKTCNLYKRLRAEARPIVKSIEDEGEQKEERYVKSRGEDRPARNHDAPSRTLAAA